MIFTISNLFNFAFLCVTNNSPNVLWVFTNWMSWFAWFQHKIYIFKSFKTRQCDFNGPRTKIEWFEREKRFQTKAVERVGMGWGWKMFWHTSGEVELCCIPANFYVSISKKVRYFDWKWKLTIFRKQEIEIIIVPYDKNPIKFWLHHW